MTPSIFERESSLELSFTYQSPTLLPNHFYSFRNRNELELTEDWMKITAKRSNFLKAAWILAFRCFQPTDVTCVSYDDGDSGRPMVYTVRVDPNWSLQSFLEQLDRATFSAVASPPETCGVQVSRHPPPPFVCTSSVYRSTPSERCLDTQVSEIGHLTTKIELVIKATETRTVASIKSSESRATGMNCSMLQTFRHVLSQITSASTGLKLQDIDYCSTWDRKIIQNFTHTTPSSEPSCLHELILTNCRRHPDKLAVCSFDGNLTYRELNDLSLRLARQLVRLGIRPETFVLSSFKKSTWAIVARLAILRAGGAYISIHASNPPTYLNSVIERTNAKIMLSDPAFADQFRLCIDTVLGISPEWLRDLPSTDTQMPLPTVQPSTACTVLFTSGSTGKPKAIIQEHRSYAAAICDYSRNLGLTENTRFLHFDDYAFDISNLEFLVPLILGGCCCVPGPMETIQDLTKNIQTLDANIAFLTPTVAIKVNPVDVPSLKILCVGGEPLPKDLLDNWAETPTKLINQFGMGEAAVCCAYNDRVHDDPTNMGGTIGRPSSGAIWIVDPSCPANLVPVGAVGEIVIEGPHLSRGYLDQGHQATDRTKPAGFLRQIPHWMSELHPERRAARLYRSGDLARLNHNGQIEYIGRKDTIVKLDGCRVDVVGVELFARKCLMPKDIVIVDLLGVIDGKEDPRLAAFLYLHDHPRSSGMKELALTDASVDRLASEKVAQIKAVLAESLPSYMIPTLFLLATRVPRTASNKTDRRMIRLLGQDYYLEDRQRRRRALSQRCDAQLLPP